MEPEKEFEGTESENMLRWAEEAKCLLPDEGTLISLNPRNASLPYQTPEPLQLLPGSTSQAHPGNKTSDRDQGTFFLQQAHQMYRESHVLRETLNAERLSRAREREQARERILELEEKLAVRSSENASLEEKLVAAVDTEVSLGKVIAAKDAEITAKDAEINDLREVVDVQTNELAKAMAAHTVQQQIASPTEAVSIGQRIEAQWTVRMAEKEQAWILEKTAMEMRLSSLEAELAKAEEIQQAYPEIFDAFIQMESIYLKHIGHGEPSTN